MNDTEQDPHARIELTDSGNVIAAEVAHIPESNNRAVVVACWIGANLQSISDMAWREHERLQAAEKPKQGAVIAEAAPRIAGPDGKPLN